MDRETAPLTVRLTMTHTSSRPVESCTWPSPASPGMTETDSTTASPVSKVPPMMCRDQATTFSSRLKVMQASWPSARTHHTTESGSCW